VRGLIDYGFAPDIGTLQKMAMADATSVRNALKRLEATHSLVCHPGSASPWVIHPFSLNPTATWGRWVSGGGPNDCENLQDCWKPAIQLDENQRSRFVSRTRPRGLRLKTIN
jgi:hypothetical protein